MAISNLLIGKSTPESGVAGDYRSSFSVDLNEFVLAIRKDFHLRYGSKVIGKAVMVDTIYGVGLRHTAEYKHPCTIRALKGGALSPGATQYVTGIARILLC